MITTAYKRKERRQDMNEPLSKASLIKLVVEVISCGFR